jgi:biotin synthase
MFEAHGLNIARQPDNAANPRPDNRSGWLSGETPDVLEEYLQPVAAANANVSGGAGLRTGPQANPEDGLNIRLWDPSQQLRYRPKRSVPPRPDGAPNRSPRRLSAR